MDKNSLKQTAQKEISSKGNATTNSSSYYLGIIQMLEQAIKSKRKTTIPKHNIASISNTCGDNLETVQNSCHKNKDSDINLQHENNEQEIAATDINECFSNKDDYNEGNKDIAKDNLNSEVSAPCSYIASSSLFACENETLDKSNAFAAEQEWKEDRCNLKETEQKEKAFKLTQVDRSSSEGLLQHEVTIILRAILHINNIWQ